MPEQRPGKPKFDQTRPPLPFRTTLPGQPEAPILLPETFEKCNREPVISGRLAGSGLNMARSG